MALTRDRPARVPLTNRARLELRSYAARTLHARLGISYTCFLCRKTIPAGEFYLKVTYQARSYRSVRDIGDTTATARVCARCVFPQEVK